MYRVIHKGKKYIFVRHKNILAIWNQLFYFSHKKTPASLIHLLWLFSVLKCILFLQQSTWDRGLIMWENITQHKTNWTSILWSMRTCWRLGIFFLLLYVYSHSVVDIGFTCESVCVCVDWFCQCDSVTRHSHETSQVCSWDQNESRVQRWAW